MRWRSVARRRHRITGPGTLPPAGRRAGRRADRGRTQRRVPDQPPEGPAVVLSVSTSPAGLADALASVEGCAHASRSSWNVVSRSRADTIAHWRGGGRAARTASGHPTDRPSSRRRHPTPPGRMPGSVPAAGGARSRRCPAGAPAGRQAAETLLHCTRHNDRGLGPASGLPLNTRPIRGIGGNPTVPVCAVVVANGPGDHSGRRPDSGGWSRPVAAPPPPAPRGTNRPAIDGRRRPPPPRTLNRKPEPHGRLRPVPGSPPSAGNPRALR